MLQLDLKELTTVGMATALAHIDADGTVYNVVHVFKKGLPTVVTRLPEKRVFDIICLCLFQRIYFFPLNVEGYGIGFVNIYKCQRRGSMGMNNNPTL